MGTFKWRCFSLVPFYLFFFILFTCNRSATSQGFDICKIVYCGMGTCHSSVSENFGFRCECESGWKKFKLGSFEFPPCVVPNCTFDLQCGNGKSPTIPSLINFNISNPCLVSVCGDGSCQINDGFEFKCECNDGSANLFNNPKLPCFNKCAVGADCNGLDLGFGPPQTPSSPTPQKSSASPGTGFGEMPNCSRELQVLTMMILATIFLNWI